MQRSFQQIQQCLTGDTEMEISTLKNLIDSTKSWDKLDAIIDNWGATGYTEGKKKTYIAGYPVVLVSDEMTGALWSWGPEYEWVFSLDNVFYAFRNNSDGGLKNFYEVEQVEVKTKVWRRKKK
jgi:hypothetical protein